VNLHLSLSLTLGLNKQSSSKTSFYELFVPRSVVPYVGTEMFINIFPWCTRKGQWGIGYSPRWAAETEREREREREYNHLYSDFV
jgi:hypothetical protein